MTELELPSGLHVTLEEGRVVFRTNNSAQLHLSIRDEFTDQRYWEIETSGRWLVNKDHIKQLIEALEYVLDSCE